MKTKTIKLWIDEKCQHCKKLLNDLKYPNIPKGKLLIIKPSYNSAERLTHYHLIMIDEKSVNWEREREIL